MGKFTNHNIKNSFSDLSKLPRKTLPEDEMQQATLQGTPWFLLEASFSL